MILRTLSLLLCIPLCSGSMQASGEQDAQSFYTAHAAMLPLIALRYRPGGNPCDTNITGKLLCAKSPQELEVNIFIPDERAGISRGKIFVCPRSKRADISLAGASVTVTESTTLNRYTAPASTDIGATLCSYAPESHMIPFSGSTPDGHVLFTVDELAAYPLQNIFTASPAAASSTIVASTTVASTTVAPAK